MEDRYPARGQGEPRDVTRAVTQRVRVASCREPAAPSHASDPTLPYLARQFMDNGTESIGQRDIITYTGYWHSKKVSSGSGRAGKLRLMGKYIGHRLVARPQLGNTRETVV